MENFQEELKKEAKKYIELGIPVIPVGKNKVPALSSWREFQTRLPTEKELDELFDQPDLQGLAVITGKFSKLVAIDIDSLNTFLDIQQRYGTPETPLVKSHKGYHLYFQYPDGIELGGSVILPNVEIKGEGNCITVPPSKHPENTQYQWIKSIFDVKPAPLPEWVLEANPNKKKGQLEKIIGGVGLGNRDNSAVSVAGKIIYSFKQEEWPNIGWTLFMSWNKENKPPLSELQLKKCWESVIKRELKKRELKLQNIKPIGSPLKYKDFYSLELPPIKWIVSDIIPYCGISVISAPPSHYKTWFCLFLAYHIASGKKLWDRFDVTQSNVLFVNEENYIGLIQERIKKMIPEKEDIPLYSFHNQGIKLNEITTQELVDICQENKIGVIIFDSLIRIHDFEENTSSEMKKVFEYFKVFALNGVSVIFTHHHRKKNPIEFSRKSNLESMRGSSEIGAFIDTHIALDSIKDNELSMIQGKQRGSVLLEPLRIKFEEIDNHFTFTLLGSLQQQFARESEARDAVLKAIEEHPSVTRKDLVAMFEKQFHSKTIQNVLMDLREMEDIYDEGNRPKHFFSKRLKNPDILPIPEL